MPSKSFMSNFWRALQNEAALLIICKLKYKNPLILALFPYKKGQNKEIFSKEISIYKFFVLEILF